MSFSSTVTLPQPNDVNTGLTSPGQHTMMFFLGVPGDLTADCSDITNERISDMLAPITIGTRQYRGIKPFVDALETALTAAETAHPGIRADLRCDGIICVRHQHGFPNTFSNHSWGAAIDLYFGNQPVPQGVPFTQSGILDLYYFFHDQKLYWGGGYHNRSRVDSMHFEVSEELLVEWRAAGTI